MKGEIKNVNLKFRCEGDWDKMAYVNGQKHCTHCSKTVYDFTDSKVQEFLNILADNNNNICGRFRADQMATGYPVLPGWKKWVSAAVVLIGINIFNNEAFAQGAPLKISDQSAKTKEPEIFVGGIGPGSGLPEFPGGPDAFTTFLTKNIHYLKTMKNGRVIISFTVSAKGVLGDFKVERSVSPINDNAALNALKLSPKWKPGTLNGKAVATRYTIPVSFQNKL